MADLLRWIPGGALLLVSALVCIGNASLLWTCYVRKRKAPSWIPLVGGITGVIGLWLLPVPAAHRWWWVPLIVDWGSVPGISHATAYYLIAHRHHGEHT
jgi:hypothetical protein